MRLELHRGAVLAGFRVESLLGEGAMGTVYLAEEPESGQRVALKLLAPELARDERFRRRFLRETELAASIEHPHVVATRAAGEEDGTLYLAMAYVEGSDLRKLLRREGPLEPERALELLEQVAGALDAAHAAGLVHRDVKPGNILVASDQGGRRAYVCDFGLARHVSSVSSLTSERGFVGTIDYVPPEQIEGGAVDGRADVYSLGCVLYECLAGARPFDRDSELSVLFAHLNDPPPRLTEVRPDLPAAFDAVFATALAKSPDDRFATCGELAAAARAALRGEVRPRRRRRRLRLAVGVVAFAGAAAVAAVLALDGGHARSNQPTSAPSISLRPSGLNLVDASTRRVVRQVGLGVEVPVADTGLEIAFTKHVAWVLVNAKQRLVRIDLASRKVAGEVAFPWQPGEVGTGGDSVWVTQDGGDTIWRLHARTGAVVRRLAIQGGDTSDGGIAYGDGSLWLASGSGVIRVDPDSGRILHRFAIPGISGGMHIVFADGSVWAARPGNGTVVKIDPESNLITQHATLHGWASDLAVGGGSVWVSIVPDGKVYRLSEDDLSVRDSVAAGSDPERLSLGGGALWVADGEGNSLLRIDQVSGARQTVHARGALPAVAAFNDGLVWVGAAPALPPLPPVQGQELHVVGGGVQYDPVHAGLWDDQVLYATCSKLLNYPDAAGPAGAQLEPEIAAAMPTLSGDGRTYTFRIRPGFRFSPPSNEAVTAATFRHTIEREIAMSSKESGTDVYGDDITGVVARGNRLSITLRKPAGDFLTRLAMPRFCPVPLTTPLRGDVDHPLPSAGPYYIASSAGGRDVLVRNPNYHGSRPRRSARIVFQESVPEAKEIALVDHGAADLIPASGSSDLLAPGGVVERRAGTAARYHLYRAPLTDYIVFNSARPLFRDVRLRRAALYALDRRALAAAFADAPADRVVPPAVSGYPVGRGFPLAPDVRAARRLAGTARRRAVLSICGDARERTLADIVRRDFARISLALSVLEDDRCPDGSAAVARTSTRADLLLVQGFPFSEADERDPAQVIDKLLGSGLYGEPVPAEGWASATFHRQLDRARPLRGAARAAAYEKLADELTRSGPVAIFGAWVWPEYFSPNVGCKVFQTVYAVADLGALCKQH